GRKARKRKPVHSRLRSACHHHIGVAKGDDPPGVADRVRAGRTCSDDRVVRALEIVGDGDLTAHQIDESSWNEERRDAPWSLFVEGNRGVVNPSQSSDSRSDQYTRLDLFLIAFGRPIGVS